MSFPSLPPEILAIIVKDSSKEDIKRLVFVSRGFRNAVRELLWQSFTISSLNKMKFVLDLFSRVSTLGRAVKSLNIMLRQVQRTGRNEKILSTISQRQFVRLIRLTPLFRCLSIRELTFESFTPNELSDKTLFPHLHTLDYFADRSSSVLSNLLSMAPSISTLSMHFRGPPLWSNPFPLCPTLYSLCCTVRDLYYQPHTTILPTTSLSQLRNLEILDSYFTPDEILSIVDLITICSSTLLRITIADYLKLDYGLLIPLFPRLTSVKDISIKLYNMPIDVFQHVPASLVEFSSSLSIDHLEHLHLNPRPSLKLEMVHFFDLILGSVKFIPRTVRSITFEQIDLTDDEEELSSWVEELEVCGRMNLEIVEVPNITGRQSKDEKESILERFKVLGIKFSYSSWGTGEEGDEEDE